MIQEGIGWFGQNSTNKEIIVGTLTNNSQFVSQNVPTNVNPGQTFTASFTYKNTGSTIWKINGNNSWWLGSENPRDNNTWGTNRAGGMINTIVRPGEIYTFTGTYTAPSQAREYYFQWQMLQNNIEWFGEKTPKTIIQVGTIVDDAEYIYHNFGPDRRACSIEFTDDFTYINTGNSIWRKGIYCLASEGPPNNTIWGTNRIELSDDVIPGDTVAFKGNFITLSEIHPWVCQPYSFQWRPSKGGDSRFGQISTPHIITVCEGPAYLGDAIDYSDMPNSMTIGNYYDFEITFLNKGIEGWRNVQLIDINSFKDGDIIPWFDGNAIAPYTPPDYTVTFRIRLFAHIFNNIYKHNYYFQLTGPNGFINGAGMNFTPSIDIIVPNKSASSNINNLNYETSISDISIMPNPATDFINILLPVVDGIQTLKIFDITGKLVYSNEYSNTGNIEVNVSEFKKGIYFLKIENQTNSYCKKVVIN